jgi:hypothetical protein
MARLNVKITRNNQKLVEHTLQGYQSHAARPLHYGVLLISVDEREAALPQVRLFDAPAEVLDLRRHMQSLDRHLCGERIPLEAIQGQEFLIHTASSFSRVGK